MTPDDFLKMTVTDILAMLKEEGSDSMKAKLTNNDGLGVLVKISYEPVEVKVTKQKDVTRLLSLEDLK